MDQMGRPVLLKGNPKRIVSLVPSQTELLHDIGLDEEVVGITRFCVHPEKWFRSKTRVGGTKKLNLDKIRQLAPDLIIGNKEENTQEEIELLSKEFPVWMSDIRTLNEALLMIESVGMITGKPAAAEALAASIEESFRTLARKIHAGSGTTLYLVWYDPIMAAGGDTFIAEMLSRCGLQNVVADKARYPEIDRDLLARLNPRTILLASEPWPFNRKQADEIGLLSPSSRVLLVDGEMFSWYGSRLLKAVPYFEKVIEQIQAGC